MIVRVNVVLNIGLLLLTVTDVLTTSAVVIFRVKVICINSVNASSITLVKRLMMVGYDHSK